MDKGAGRASLLRLIHVFVCVCVCDVCRDS